MKTTVITLAALLLALIDVVYAADKPNILWFVVDDMSPNFSCYGEKTITTPNVDQLAHDGTLFTHAYVTAPVCSACRSALITGMYQTTIGAQHHRSGRGVEKIYLPEGVTPIPLLFQKAGYYTCIGSGLAEETVPGKQGKDDRLGKTDYNFEWDAGMYDGPDWSGRKPGQPFFMQVQTAGGKLRGNTDVSASKLSKRAARELGSAVLTRNTSRFRPITPAIRCCSAIGLRISTLCASPTSTSAKL